MCSVSAEAMEMLKKFRMKKVNKNAALICTGVNLKFNFISKIGCSYYGICHK